jgi:hypothetical protein
MEDGGGRGEKRRRHDDKLEAMAAELACCGGGSSSSSSGGSAVAAAAQRNPDCLNFFGKKRPILCVTEKKAIPISTAGTYQNRFPNRGWSPREQRK